MILSTFDTMDLDPIVVARVAVVVSIGLLILAARKRRTSALYPPYAPCSTLETVRVVSSSDYIWWVLRVARQLKTRVFQVSLPFPAPMLVVVGETDTFRKVMTDPLTKKPLEIYRNIASMSGGVPTIFTTNDKIWHSKRKSIAPAFSSNHVRRMNKVAMDKTNYWIEHELRPLIQSGGSFDVAKEMLNITLDAICETAFEYQMSKEEKSLFATELELGLIEFAVKSAANPIRRFFGPLIPERRRAFVAARNVQNLAMKIQDSYRNMEAPTEGTIIDRIMKSDAFESDEERAGQIMEFFIAGHDTTGYSISWILLELARNPEEQRRLRAALSSMAPEDWSRCDVLKMMVKEGMRLHPVASAGTVRVIGKDMMTSKKELLPKGTIVFTPFILLFRNPEIFVNENSFCPSRWENPSREMLDSLNPFALGKQNCMGQSLANAEMHYIVARICSEFDLSIEEEGSVDFFLTLKPVGARLKAKKA